MRPRHTFAKISTVKRILRLFADFFIRRIAPQTESISDENFVLQQI